MQNHFCGGNIMQHTNQTAQFNLFGAPTDEDLKGTKKRRSYRKQAKPNPNDSIVLAHGEATVVRSEDGFIVRHHNSADELPDHMIMLSDEFDGKNGDLVLQWTNKDLLTFWDGMLTEHLKQLRQTKPGSASREDILQWQQSECFKDICDAISFQSEDIRDGVLAALKNYDSIAQTTSIVSMLVKLDPNVVQTVEQANLSRRDCNSRRFKDQLADYFLTELRKAKKSATKWESIIAKLHSEKLRDLADQIGLDMSGVINRVKDKMYFVQNPTDAEEYDF